MKRVYEFLKSIVLLGLVCSTVVMSMQALVFERVIPYNTGVKSSLITLYYGLMAGADAAPEGGVADRDLWASSVTLLSPDADQTLYFGGTASASQISAVCGLAAQILSTGAVAEAGADFASLMTDGSIVLDLGREMTVGMFLELCGYSDSRPDMMRRLLLTGRDGGCALFFESGGRVEGCFSTAVEADTLRQAAEGVERSGLTVAVRTVGRSVDMDVPAGSISAIEGRTAFSRVMASNPLFVEDGAVQLYALQSALSAFGYSASTLRRDEDEDGTLVYVENYSNIRIHPSGALIYRASEPRRGVPLSRWLGEPDGGYTAYGVVKAGYALLDSFQPSMTGSPAGGLRYSGARWDDEADELIVCYDYVVAGLPVNLKGAEHAVSLTYCDGYFSQATIHFRGYEVTGEPYYPAGADSALRLAQITAGETPTGLDIVYNDAGGLMLPRYELTVKDGME